ncbi:MAG: hypothetical protein WC518_02990 [Patescibacteria group bacterium]
MFGSKKQKAVSQSINTNPAPSATPPSQDIYVMPQKFHPLQNRSSGKKLVIVFIVLIIVVAVSATYFFYDLWQRNQAKPLAVVNTNTNTNSNIIINTNSLNSGLGNGNENNNTSNLNEAANENIETNLNGEINANVDNNINTNNKNNNTNETISLNPPPVSSDSDRDGLTDLEENAIGTSPSLPDTDKDSYLDGSELVNGYDPLKSGGAAKLSLASFIQVVASSFPQDNFQILAPKNWSGNVIEASRQILITTKTGEIIRVSVRENPDRLSAVNWYAQANPQVNLSQLSLLKVGDLEGIVSPDELKVYLADDERTKIYSFEYIMSDDAEFRYPTLFQMIVKSFKPLATTPTTNETSSSTPENINS